MRKPDLITGLRFYATTHTAVVLFPLLKCDTALGVARGEPREGGVSSLPSSNSGILMVVVRELSKHLETESNCLSIAKRNQERTCDPVVRIDS